MLHNKWSVYRKTVAVQQQVQNSQKLCYSSITSKVYTDNLLPFNTSYENTETLLLLHNRQSIQKLFNCSTTALEYTEAL